MKKILNALFLTLFAVLTFSSCSDVPSPYDIIKGDFQLTGEGTQNFPYTISDLKKITGGKADGKTVAWVEAYIVAGIKSSANLSINSANDVVFGTQPADVKATAILIADSSTESDYTKCSAVNLNGKVVGCSDVKAALNLVDNNTIELPRLIKFKGTLVDNTWGLPGLKDVTAAILENGTLIGEGGSDIPTDENNPFGLDDSNPLSEINADFEEQPDFVQEGTYTSNLNYDYSLEGWKNVAFVGDRKWTGVVFKDNTKYIQASANKGSAETYTSWFVSPAFTVDNIKDKTIEFDCAGAYFYATTTLKVYFLELVNGVMQKTEIPVTGIPTSGTNYDWVKGIKIDLSGQPGKIGFIGFEYVAEGGEKKSTTYQIDNIKSGKSEGGGETPGGDDPFGLDASNPKSTFIADFEEITEFNKDYTLEGWINKAIQASNVWQSGIYNKVDKYIKATPYNVAQDETMEAWFITPAFTVTPANKFTFDCAGANWKEDMKLKVFFLQKNASGVVTKEEITVSQIPTSGDNFEWVKDVNVNLDNYNGKVGFIGFQYTVISTGVNKNLPTYQIDNVKYEVGEGGGIIPEPSGELLKNGSFEVWNDAKPEGWGRGSVTNATYSKYTESSIDGTISVLISNTTTGNKRLGSEDVKLAAGKYTVSVYAKNAVAATTAKLKVGYVPIEGDGTVNSNNYKYVSGTDAISLTDEWTKYEYLIELEAEQTVSIVFMSSGSKSNPAKNMLIDNISLVKKSN